MTKKKRRVFDIDFDSPAPEVKSAVPAGTDAPQRRGPMATAISETAEALDERAEAEAAIRAENDRLAHEHVRLKKLGLITDLIPVAEVMTTKLTRDRSEGVDPELEELKASIAAVGLSNPIRVEQTENGYELIQGFRRLSAFKALHEETGDPRYSRIPAGLVPRGESLQSLYRKMVDENLVRKDISFAEMAMLAMAYADQENTDYPTAIAALYESAGRQKKIYIRNFTRLLARLGKGLKFAEAIPRALGLELDKKLEAEPGSTRQLMADLAKLDAQSAEEEIAALRNFLTARPKSAARPTSAKTTLRLRRKAGEAKCLAADGKLTLQVNKDFSAMDRHKLEAALLQFLDALDS
ncbi:ParB/RepB/Spo0J family partition protein [Shimia ponticola]|uniref:ParB/RepB/Spo0J family partition protein n=1 Tax=Shimia ponticola TaxID=2582893 RepID=UPI0011BDF6A1|nr:ParB N-terminal domain-containing protein [Shimia ponticola]